MHRGKALVTTFCLSYIIFFICANLISGASKDCLCKKQTVNARMQFNERNDPHAQSEAENECLAFFQMNWTVGGTPGREGVRGTSARRRVHSCKFDSLPLCESVVR